MTIGMMMKIKFDPSTVLASLQSAALGGLRSVCVTITLTDELLLARPVFEYTINYHSTMIYGQPRLVTDRAGRPAGCAASRVGLTRRGYCSCLGGVCCAEVVGAPAQEGAGQG